MSAFYKSYHPYIKPEQEPQKSDKFKKKYTDAEIQTITRMRKAGASWDEVGSALGRTGESCYKAMKNRAYRANKVLKVAKQTPVAPAKVSAPDRTRIIERVFYATTAALTLVNIVLVLKVVGVI